MIEKGGGVGVVGVMSDKENEGGGGSLKRRLGLLKRKEEGKNKIQDPLPCFQL